MKLNPIETTTEPTYPTYRPIAPTWRKLASAVAVAAALWLPACGEDPTRLSGEPPVPQVNQPQKPEEKPADVPADPPPRLSGMFPPIVKPPPVDPPPVDPPVRMAGEAAPVTPPPQVRLAGAPRSAELPGSLQD